MTAIDASYLQRIDTLLSGGQRVLLGIVGAAGYLVPGSPGAVLRGRVEATGRQAQINTFGGGVNEVQREIFAMAGLGMKRDKR